MTATTTVCPHCSAQLMPGTLHCPHCNRWVYEERLQQLMQQANAAQQTNPMLAAGYLREAMTLVPPGSPPYETLANYVRAFAAQAFRAPGEPLAGQAYRRPGESLAYEPRPAPASPQNDTWLTALLKTGGSMALSIFIYKQELGLPFAIGFVLLILLHELGHVVANWYFGIKQGPPIFIPYVGAVIWLRQNPSNAKAESVIGIAGPIAGTAASLACFGIFLATRQYIFYQLAFYGMLMNLFNMIPIAPLDGGRVSAAITPWLWIPGAILFVAALWGFGGGRSDAFINILIGVLILRSAWPRIQQTLFAGGIHHPYYRVGVTGRLLVIFSYVLLTLLLLVMLFEPFFAGLIRI